MLKRLHVHATGSVIVLVIALLAPVTSALAQDPPDPPRGDLRFVVFGDFNGPYGSLSYPPAVAKTIRAISDIWQPDLLLSPGDVIAGQDRSLPGERFAEMWRVFDQEVAAPLRVAGIPYAVTMGNHDASSSRDSSGSYFFARERQAAEAYWSSPMYDANLSYADRERYPFDHAFLFGKAFVVILDASSATVDPRQRSWLEQMFERPEAQAAGLRVVVGHLPLIAVGRGREGPGEVLADAREIRRILEAGKVDIYISGHHAAYYPGRLGDLELLFAGGVGARALLAGDALPRSTVTLVDVWWKPMEVRYSTFDVATMEVVSPASLPPLIGTGEWAGRLSERAADLPAEEPGADGQR